MFHRRVIFPRSNMPETVDTAAELNLASLAVAVALGQYVPSAATRRALADLAAAVARADAARTGVLTGPAAVVML